jgi:hypothetical protein
VQASLCLGSRSSDETPGGTGHAFVTMRPCAIGKAPLRRREYAAPLYRPAVEYIKLA